MTSTLINYKFELWVMENNINIYNILFVYYLVVMKWHLNLAISGSARKVESRWAIKTVVIKGKDPWL